MNHPLNLLGGGAKFCDVSPEPSAVWDSAYVLCGSAVTVIPSASSTAKLFFHFMISSPFIDEYLKMSFKTLLLYHTFLPLVKWHFHTYFTKNGGRVAPAVGALGKFRARAPAVGRSRTKLVCWVSFVHASKLLLLSNPVYRCRGLHSVGGTLRSPFTLAGGFHSLGRVVHSMG